MKKVFLTLVVASAFSFSSVNKDEIKFYENQITGYIEIVDCEPNATLITSACRRECYSVPYELTGNASFDSAHAGQTHKPDLDQLTERANFLNMVCESQNTSIQN